jgi:hypothetical protein
MRRIVDEILSQAMQDGSFDNLPGQGKPLTLNDSSRFEDPTWRMAHRIMKEHEVLPPWIAERKEISTKVEALRTALTQAWERRQKASAAHFTQADKHWQRTCEEFAQSITRLNKRIFDYNLTAPLSQHLLTIDAAREISKITG